MPGRFGKIQLDGLSPANPSTIPPMWPPRPQPMPRCWRTAVQPFGWDIVTGVRQKKASLRERDIRPSFWLLNIPAGFTQKAVNNNAGVGFRGHGGTMRGRFFKSHQKDIPTRIKKGA